MVDEDELGATLDRCKPRHELRMIDARPPVKGDHDGLVDQLAAAGRRRGAVNVEEKLHAVDRRAHRSGRLAAGQHGVDEPLRISSSGACMEQ